METARVWTFPLTGAVAGALSTVVFAGIHALLISDIWFFITPMIVAGTVCGLCVAWSYGILSRPPTIRSWVVYNTTYIALLIVLGVASILFFEPVTTVQSLINSPLGLEEADRLMAQAMPLTIGFTLGGAALVTLLFGRRWWHLVPVMITMALVILLLGLNVSILGLVEVQASSAYLIVEVFGLIVTIVSVYAVSFVAMEWKKLRRY